METRVDVGWSKVIQAQVDFALIQSLKAHLQEFIDRRRCCRFHILFGCFGRHGECHKDTTLHNCLTLS